MGVGGIFDEMMDWKAALERDIKIDFYFLPFKNL